MRRIFLTITVLAIGLTLAGCTGRDASPSGASDSTPGDVNVLPYEAPQFPGGAGDQAVEATKAADLIGSAAERQVITSGSVAITVESPARAADDAARITESAGGHVDGRVERAATDARRGDAQLTLRIPALQLTTTLDALKKLGIVEKVSLTKQDVTATTLDLAARITALSTSVDRLTALMTTAASTADLITIESALSERQATLESLQSQARDLTGQVEFSTIRLDLGTSETAPVKAPDDFLSGLLTGWVAFTSFFAGVIVVAGILVPWLLSAVVLGGVAVLVRLRLRKRQSPSQ